MRRILATRRFALAGALLLFFLGAGAVWALAQVTGKIDSTGLEATITDKKEGEQVKIRIDERGISIEGGALDTQVTPDVSNHYIEKGTDIVKFGEDFYVASNEIVRGDLVIFGGDVRVDGIVGGNAVVIGGDIEIRSGAKIKGDAVVLGGELEEAPGAVIQGERVSFKGFIPSKIFIPGFFDYHTRVLRFFLVPVKFFIALVLGFLVVLFLRDRVLRSEQHISSGLLKSFGIGFLIVFVGSFTLLILTVLLCIIIIGIPLAFLLIVSAFGITILSWTIFAYALGEALRKRLQFQSTNAFFIVFIGTLVLFLPNFIGYGISLAPILHPLGAFFNLIGFLFRSFAVIAGLGALFTSRFGAREIVSPAPVQASAAP